MAVVPAKRARLNRARASRDPVIHGRRECTNRLDYWIAALPRVKPGVGRNDGKDVAARRAARLTEPHAITLRHTERGSTPSMRRC